MSIGVNYRAMRTHIVASFILVLAVSFVTPAPEAQKENSRDLIKCNGQPGDVELTYVQIRDNGHYAGKVDIDFIYPPEGEEANNAINCVMIKSMDDSGTATITSGELGETRMSIKLTSSFTKGATFTIQILGQPILYGNATPK
ncbi:hypothetical protein J437_LFUL009616 [Ladona fulva]|uniref:Uncharacterized protein n=1 Tax=Ladona fulva TaxID=123851 RepID=A0A8K0K9U8_LADFU|nr:hypothetical protein J437_LFUL009616 [Ladona fulva]